MLGVLFITYQFSKDYPSPCI